jgi:phospho-N-acetylmuramoyl-pentapeptide-transferase
VIYWLGEFLAQYYGPFRLLTSHLVLSGLSVLSCFILSFYLLPRLMNRLPRDRGRNHAIQGAVAAGKPTGAGVIFICLFVAVELLFLPWSVEVVGILLLTFGAMMSGWLDDKSVVSWGEYKKGLIDMVLAIIAAFLLSGFSDVEIWLPFTSQMFLIPLWLFIPLATILLWATINSTNCTDGVDGLSGTLTAFAFASLGALLYFILGHKEISAHLLLPHYADGANWGMMAFSMVGCILGYLWYNANPSILLMGDAGSRALGFLLGVFVIKSGNPFCILIVSAVLMVNGGTGLVKVAIMRFFKVAFLKSIRFPLHDHVRHNKGWSNTQVLVRFALIQVMITLTLMIFLIKVR